MSRQHQSGLSADILHALKRVRQSGPLLKIAVAICLLVTLYGAGAFGVFAFLNYHQGIVKVSYGDVFLPSRWNKSREIKGDHYIETGKKALLEGEVQKASNLIHAGLRLSPANVAGRLSLAQIYLDLKRRDLAEACLKAGLSFHARNPDYLNRFLSFLLDQNQDATVLRICQDLLPLLPSDTDRDRLLALAAATACYFRGNFDQADDYIRIASLKMHREGKLLSAQIAWEQGYRELAAIEIRELQIQHPNDPAIYAELARMLRALNRHDEERRLAISFQIENPDKFQPRLDIIRHFLNNGDFERANTEIDSALRVTPDKLAALVALGDLASSMGNSALASRLEQKARSLNIDAEPLLLLSVEADLSAGSYRIALDRIKSLHSTHPQLAKTHSTLLNSFQAIAQFGLGEPEFGELSLSKFLQVAPPRAPHLLKIAERLLAVSAIDPALRVLKAAIHADPLNQAALARLVSIELAHHRTAELPTHLHLLLAARRPPPDLLRVAHHQLGSDSFLFISDRGPLLNSIHAQLAAAESQQRRFN